MNNKERVLAALNLKRPDRVPLMCQFSIGFMMSQLKRDPVDFWYDERCFADGLIELRKKFNFDGILVSLHGHSNDWRQGLLHREELELGRVLLIYADRTELHSWTDLPIVQFKEASSPRSIDNLDPERDIPEQIDYIPVSHNLYFKLNSERMYSIFDYIYSQVGEAVSIHGEITSPFDYFLDLLGYEGGLMALIMAPEKCKRILARYTQGVKRIAIGMCSKQIDAIKISSPFAGMGFISTDFYEEFVLPYEREIINAIRACGKHVYIHTCGSIGDRLELMACSGVSGLECLDPVPVGNVDLEDAFNRIGDRLFIKGNIDSVNSLLLGNEEKARQDVIKIIEIGKRLGHGFILSTACSIAPLVTTQRIEMLSSLIHEYGLYENDDSQEHNEL